VADALVAESVTAQAGEFNEKQFVARAMNLGESYRLLGKVSAESVSTVLFRQALALARNRGLIDQLQIEGGQIEDGQGSTSTTIGAARIRFSEDLSHVIEAGATIDQ
jgi:glycerol-3-phosphate O-acyltransferase